MNKEEIDLMKNLRPIDYAVTCSMGGTPGDTVEATFVINRSDFAVCSIQYAVLGDDGTDPQQFLLDWSEQNTIKYNKSQNGLHAQIYGSVRHGIWKEYVPPINLALNTTVFIKLTNVYAAAGNQRNIQVVFSGYETKRE